MTDTARLGVVGLGGMGYTHTRNLRDLGHEIVAGADVQAGARESFADEFGVVTYEEFEAMYDDAAIDGVVITTPNAFHAPAAIAALEAGIDVLCEKPLAASVADAEAMVAAEREADAFGMVGFQRRFAPGAELFKAHQAAGRFGEITHVEGHTIRRRGIPGVGSWFTTEELSGGGAVIDIGVHLIDFVLHLLDYPEIEEVSGVTRANFGGRADYADPDDWGAGRGEASEEFDVEDSASAFVRTAGGTTISLEIAWATNREPSGDVIVRGTEAGATMGGSTLTVHEAGREGVDHYADTELEANDDYDVQRRKVAVFADGILEGEAPGINTFEQGLLTQRVMDGIYRSSERGEAVSIG